MGTKSKGPDNTFRTNPIQVGKFTLKAKRSAASAAEFFGLSHRELELLDCLGVGMTGPEIAEKMGVSVNTVNTYKERTIKKLGVQNITVAVNLIVAYCSGADIERNAS